MTIVTCHFVPQDMVVFWLFCIENHKILIFVEFSYRQNDNFGFFILGETPGPWKKKKGGVQADGLKGTGQAAG